MQTATCYEVRTPDGALVCRLHVTEQGVSATNHEASSIEPQQGKGKEQERGKDAAMTSPQKRLLFRLMATQQGLEGEKAHEELKKRFRAKSLQEVSKLDASRMIEQLLEGKGGNGHGSPVQ